MKKKMKPQVWFVVCIENKGYEASLEIAKLYCVIPDQDAESHGYLRIVDESGEDYGYSADRFISIDVPKSLATVLLKPRHNRTPNRALQRTGARAARSGR